MRCYRLAMRLSLVTRRFRMSLDRGAVMRLLMSASAIRVWAKSVLRKFHLFTCEMIAFLRLKKMGGRMLLTILSGDLPWVRA